MQVPLVDAAGSDFDIGFQFGSALRSRRALLLDSMERSETRLDAQRHPDAERRLDEIAGLLARHSPPTLGQLEGLASALDLTPTRLLRWVMAGYLIADLDAGQLEAPAEGCTVWGTSGARASAQGPLLVKNRDQPPDSLPLQAVLRARPADGIPWAAVTTLGAPGVHSSGMNAAGLAIADTAVPSRDLGPGVPRYSLMLHVLAEHDTVDSALAYLMSAPMVGGGNLVLADAEGTVAVVECGHRSRACSLRRSGTLVSTNHFTSAALEDAYALDSGCEATASSHGRYALVNAMLAQCAADISPAFAWTLMSRHGAPDEAICRHGSEQHPSQTISCVIFDLQARQLEICHGNPCAATHRTIPVA